jgi:integrase
MISSAGSAVTPTTASRKRPQRPSSFDPQGVAAPLTDTVLKALIDGAAGDVFDAVMILALSGLRFEELRRLRVMDCSRGAFRIRGCAANGGRHREVPLHGALGNTIIRLTKGRPINAYLFQDGADAEGAPSLLLRRFDAYRETVGAAEASCAIHSLRRWFVRTALDADQTPEVVATVIGHEHAPSGDDHSEKRPRWGELCICVERVRLPRADF